MIMKSINYTALNNQSVKRRKTISGPIAALLIGTVTLMVTLIGPLFLSDILFAADTFITLTGLVLFVVFVMLLCRHIYDIRSKRDKLLRAFTSDNNFRFKSHPPGIFADYNTQFKSNSSLLSAVRTFNYIVTSRSTMTLAGIYAGLDFSITVVEMHRSRRGDTPTVSFFGTITLHSDKLQSHPHMIALSKSTGRLTSTLNTEVIEKDAWQSCLIGWEADAKYDMYIAPGQGSNDMSDQYFSEMLSRIHSIDGSDVEINEGCLYIIKTDGIKYTTDGLQAVFDKIAAAAKCL